MKTFKKIVTALAAVALVACTATTAKVSSATIGDAIDANGTITNAVSVFTVDTPEIFLQANLENAPAETAIRGEWWYLTGNVKIVELPLQTDATGNQNTLNLSLSKPSAGWPAGDYEVRLYVEDRETADKVAPFSVK